MTAEPTGVPKLVFEKGITFERVTTLLAVVISHYNKALIYLSHQTLNRTQKEVNYHNTNTPF